MAAVEPAQRAQELQFLLRMLTERPPIPPPASAEARSYPIGNWFRPPWEPSAADAINLSMAVMGPKLGPSGRPMPIVNKPGLVEAVRGEGVRGAGQTQAAERQAQGVFDDINMTYGSGDTQPGTVDIGPTIGRLSEYPTTTPRRIINQTKAEGGYSVNLPTGDVPKTGIMAGKFANADPRTRVIQGDPTMVDITDWVKQNEKVLGKTENYVGTWKNDENGKTYLDVSRRFEPDQLRQATKFGEKTGQISLYNVGLPKGDPNRYPPVGNYPKYVSGEATPAGAVPYSQKLSEMGRFGSRYMRDQPTGNWWDIPDIERVYGRGQYDPQTAGFMGATSTNTAPRENVQAFSEYMRRLMANEPTIQGDFRIPQTAMGGFAGPGKTMGLEPQGMKGTRFHNLNAARAGDLGAMRGEVVREKTQALMGDPLTSVLDRIHARLTEAPKAGVYATAEEGKVPEGADRQVIKDAMDKQAAAEGKDPRRFSAEVWVGIREWIKKTGDLYGVDMSKTRSATRNSPSKSYNDIFVDLVTKKAKHLGISIAEMEKRLRSGDGELLSYLLSAPAGAAIYKLSRGSQ